MQTSIFLGLPPFAPLARAASTFLSEETHPPLRPISDKNCRTTSGIVVFIFVSFLGNSLVRIPVDIIVVVSVLFLPSLGARLISLAVSMPLIVVNLSVAHPAPLFGILRHERKYAPSILLRERT